MNHWTFSFQYLVRIKGRIPRLCFFGQNINSEETTQLNSFAEANSAKHKYSKQLFFDLKYYNTWFLHQGELGIKYQEIIEQTRYKISLESFYTGFFDGCFLPETSKVALKREESDFGFKIRPVNEF